MWTFKCNFIITDNAGDRTGFYVILCSNFIPRAGSKDATTATTTPNQGNLPNASLPNITGSIPLRTTISEAISSKVKTNLSDAVTIAQKAVGSNTSATLAFIRPLNGYLVYDVHVRNNSNNILYAVIVDPGNGKVLYKQTPPSLKFGFSADRYGMFGKGKMGPFFGGHGGGRWFGDMAAWWWDHDIWALWVLL
jgi:hypothetical protein